MCRSHKFLTAMILAIGGVVAPTASAQSGACCQPGGTCAVTTLAACTAPGVFGGSGTTCPVAGALCFIEAESNNTKATANLVTISSTIGDKLVGSCSSTDIDYWHITMPPLAAGIYRNVLTVTPTPTTPAKFVHKLWGLNQSAGVIGSTDTAVFTSNVNSAVNNARSVSWVGFGKQEQLNYSIEHSATTATAYTVTYARAGINPIDMTATSLNAGPITCRVRTFSGNVNADCWLYDSNLNPVANDATGPAGARTSLVAGSPAGTMNSFIHTLPAGTYYLAIGGASVSPDPQGNNYSNLANIQPSVAADTTGAGLPVLELPNALVCGVSLGAAYTVIAEFVDTAGHTVSTPSSGTSAVSVAANWGGNVFFVKFMVIQPFLPSGVLSYDPSPAIPGSSTVLSIAVTPGTGGASADITSVSADISALTSTPPTTISLSSADGGVTWTGLAPVDLATTLGNKSIPYTVVEGGTVPGTLNSSGTVTVGPMNDPCSGAIAVTVGTPSAPVDNQYAGTNDGPAACVATVGKGLWYSVTPSVTGLYQIDTCGSAFNTVLSVYQIGSCADSGTWTLVGCNDDRPAGTCVEAQSSALRDLSLTAGTTYHVRVQSFNNSGTFTTGNAVVTVTLAATGACCNNSTGDCTTQTALGCATSTTTYKGDNSLCDSSPCVAIATCCDITSGTCRPIYGGNCNGTESANIATACDPTPCAVVRVCCNNTSGLCTPMYGGTACAFGTTVAAGAFVCDPTPCVAIGTCCDFVSGNCRPIYGGSCNGTEAASSATACDPTPCTVVRVCCNNSTGLCAPMYGGTACVSGNTLGTGLTCEATTCDIVLGACCQQQTGTCALMFSADCAALALPGTFLGRTVACTGGLCFGEHEPNSTTFADFLNDPAINPATLSSGDAIAGIATGGDFDAGNNGNGTASNPHVDFWLLSTSTQPLGIYRHEMAQVQGSPSQGYGLRGRGQNNGVLSGGNNPVQGSAGGTTRMTAWYGFGKQEKVILEPFSGSTTPYVYQLTDTPVTPTDATGTLVDGAVTIRVISTGATTIDSDIWLYDSNLNALTNGAEGPGGAEGQLATGDPAGTTSSFTRTLAPGTYYLAVCPSNLANDQPNDPIEAINSTGADTHFLTYSPDVVICSRMAQTIEYTAHIELTDGSSNTVISPDIAWTGTWNGLVHFVRFTVGVIPSGSCCAADGSCTETTNANCTAGTWTLAGTCTPNTCPQPTGACCCGSSCSITLPGACVGTNKVFAGSGVSCTPFSNTVPCCRGNYNKSAALPHISVQDIFDFLSGYFANDPCANTNDTVLPVLTNGVSVQDIFDFLSAYFAGGC